MIIYKWGKIIELINIYISYFDITDYFFYLSFLFHPIIEDAIVWFDFDD
jgi:hypothetical protein